MTLRTSLSAREKAARKVENGQSAGVTVVPILMYSSLYTFTLYHAEGEYSKLLHDINTLRTGDANLRHLRFCVTTVKDG
jgi:hypothetical protein